MFSFSQLTEHKTQAELFEELKGFLEDAGIDTTNWTPGSPSMMNLQLDAFLYYQLLQRISSTAKNQLNQFSEGEFLTLLAKSRFDNERILAERTSGLFHVSAQPYAVPVHYDVGECEVKDNSTSLVFVNAEPINLTALDSSGTFRFEAREAGAAYNIGSNSDLVLVSTQLGVSVSNPPLVGSLNWYDSPGRDEESDDSLRARNASKFATLQRGESIAAGIEYLVRTASGAEHVKIDDTNPRGAGSLNVYLANGLETATPSQVTLAQDILNLHVFGNENYLGTSSYRAQAYQASTTVFDRAITVFFSPSYPEATIEALVHSTLNDWIASHPIGGKSYTVGGTGAQNVANLSELTDALMDIEGIRRVTFADPSEFTVGPYNKLVPPVGGWESTITLSRLDV